MNKLLKGLLLIIFIPVVLIVELAKIAKRY